MKDKWHLRLDIITRVIMTTITSPSATVTCMHPLLLMLGLTKYYEEKINLATKSMKPILPKDEPLTTDIPVEPHRRYTI